MENKVKENQSIGRKTSSEFDAVEMSLIKPRSELLESMSAMMDDEADPLEIRRLVKSLEQAPQLLSQWRRFHVLRASLQQDIHQLPSVDLLAGIKAELADEPVAKVWSGTVSGPSRTISRLFRFAGQGLIAASVAAAVLVAYPLLKGNHGGPESVLTDQHLLANSQSAVKHDSLPQLNGDFSDSPLTRTVSLDDAARQRLEKAVRNFSGTSAVLNADTSAMFLKPLEPFAPDPHSLESSVPRQ